MKPTYEAVSESNWKEYVRLNLAIERDNMPFWSGVAIFEILAVVLCIAYFAMGQKANAIAFLLICTIFPPCMALRVYLPIRLSYRKYKDRIEGLRTKYSFYEKHFAMENRLQKGQVLYSDLTRILMSKDNIFLILPKKRAFILQRSACSEDLIAFLAEKANEVNYKKARRRAKANGGNL